LKYTLKEVAVKKFRSKTNFNYF